MTKLKMEVKKKFYWVIKLGTLLAFVGFLLWGKYIPAFVFGVFVLIDVFHMAKFYFTKGRKK